MKLRCIFLLLSAVSSVGAVSIAAEVQNGISAERMYVQMLPQIARLRIQKYLTQIYHEEVGSYLKAKGLLRDPLPPQFLETELGSVSQISDALALALSQNALLENPGAVQAEGRGIRRWRMAIREALAESEKPTKLPSWVHWVLTQDGRRWYPDLIFSALSGLSLISLGQAVRRRGRRSALA